MATVDLKPLPPAEAIKYFRSKGYAIGFDWRDIWQQEHAAAFTVAKAMRIDILEDIRAAVDSAIAEGTTFATFKKTLEPTLAEKGWWGRTQMTDPKTGAEKIVQLGSPRRLRVIFDTNLRTAHSAGRWSRIERVKERRPYLRYVAVLDERTRQEHRGWHGTVRPVDDAFWETHYPPNGWNCRCVVQQLSDRDLKRFGYQESSAPKIKTRAWKNKRTGQTLRVPDGIDPGFAYNVGKARLRAFTPPPLGGLPVSFPSGTQRPPMPAPRAAPAGRILPDGLPDADYVGRFLGAFGAKPGRPIVFTDAAGENLVISEQLFHDATGAVKVTKAQRHRQLLLLADAIKKPDEIWWFWEERRDKPGAYSLRRRYVARWDVAGQRESGLSVFEWGQDGWRGVTTFAPRTGRQATAQDRYLAGMRTGTLAYRRK